MLEVISGCMFSGKSEELIRLLKRAVIAGQNVLALKPSIDNRYSEGEIASHSKVLYSCVTFSSETELREILNSDLMKGVSVVGIDEGQFLSSGFIDDLKSLLSKDKRVIISGLDKDYLGNPFGIMPSLMAMSDRSVKLSAICVNVAPSGKICGRDASMTYRLSSSDTGSIVQVGEKDSYEARCRSCWNVGMLETNRLKFE
jgi:thymidine kinase